MVMLSPQKCPVCDAELVRDIEGPLRCVDGQHEDSRGTVGKIVVGNADVQIAVD